MVVSGDEHSHQPEAAVSVFVVLIAHGLGKLNAAFISNISLRAIGVCDLVNPDAQGDYYEM